MLTYIIRRLLQVPFVVFGVMLLTFILFRSIGGNPAYRIAGKNPTAKRIAEISHQNGYDKPMVFGRWAKEVLEEGSAAGVLATKEKDRAIFKFTPTGGKATLPLEVMDPDYEKLYRLQFRIVAPQGGTLRVYVAFKETAPENVLHDATLVLDKPLAASPTAATVVVDTAVPPPEAAPDVLTEKTVPVRLQVKYFLEFTGKEATVLDVRALRRQASPFDSQLFNVLKNLVRFEFGESTETKQRVSTLFAKGIVPSLCVTVPQFTIILLLSISIALVCAYYRNSLLDRTLVVLSVIGMSFPLLIYCILIQNFAAEHLQDYGIPVWGFESPRYLILPLFISTVAGLGGSLRFYRTIVLNERYQDYVRTATAKGCSNQGILFRHVLKNAMIPILTNVVIAIPFLYVGALLYENFFGIPGAGWLTAMAIPNGDEPVLFASVFIGSIVYVFANLLCDISYALVDPRIRLK